MQNLTPALVGDQIAGMRRSPLMLRIAGIAAAVGSETASFIGLSSLLTLIRFIMNDHHYTSWVEQGLAIVGRSNAWFSSGSAAHLTERKTKPLTLTFRSFAA